MNPGQNPEVNRDAQDMQLSEEALETTTAEPEQALHEGPAESSERLMQREGHTPAADPAQREQAAEQSAHPADTTAPQKPQILQPVISVLADCTEEGSPRGPLAVIQIPQQHAEGVPQCLQAISGPPSEAEHMALKKPDPQKSADSAKQSRVSASRAKPVAGENDSEQAATTEPPQQPGALAAGRPLSDAVQQLASSSLSGTVPDTGRLDASSAPHALDKAAAPGGAYSTGNADSPKRERRPSSKAAEVPALPPKGPGSPGTSAQHAPALRRRPARSRRAWKEGTYIGNGMWLMCYCSRHRRALEEMGASRAVVSMTTGQGLQDALSPQPKARQISGRVQALLQPEAPQAAAAKRCPDGMLHSILPYTLAYCYNLPRVSSI